MLVPQIAKKYYVPLCGLIVVAVDLVSADERKYAALKSRVIINKVAHDLCRVGRSVAIIEYKSLTINLTTFRNVRI
jgi:hypothetical protein